VEHFVRFDEKKGKIENRKSLNLVVIRIGGEEKI
jgi:hypothetical protein